MLKLENIVAGYGHITALKDVSLEVPQGSVVSLICLLYTSDAADD